MSTILDAEPVVLEELDFETPCEGGDGSGNDCIYPARWTYWWSCGCISPFCQLHHETAQTYNPYSWFCDPHECAITLLRFAPLEKGSGL